jgi:hypothetical protein
MGSNNGVTFKAGRYGGAGDALHLLRVKDHAPSGCTPLGWLPANAEWGMIFDNEDWMWLKDITSQTDPRFTWSLTETGANSSTWSHIAGGQEAKTDAASADAIRFQMLKTYTPAAKKRAVAFARVEIDDVVDSDFRFGFYATQTDPVSTEPLHGAYFWKADNAATMIGRTNDAGASGTSTSTLATLVNATKFDICVGIDPTSGSAGTVFFCYKLASASSWTQVTKTTDFPAAATRFSFMLQAGAAARKTAVFNKGFAWWEN